MAKLLLMRAGDSPGVLGCRVLGQAAVLLKIDYIATALNGHAPGLGKARNIIIWAYILGEAGSRYYLLLKAKRRVNQITKFLTKFACFGSAS